MVDRWKNFRQLNRLQMELDSRLQNRQQMIGGKIQMVDDRQTIDNKQVIEKQMAYVLYDR